VVVVGIAAVGAAGEIVGLGTCCAEVVEVGGSRIRLEALEEVHIRQEDLGEVDIRQEVDMGQAPAGKALVVVVRSHLG
jgi:hypothetical protein